MKMEIKAEKDPNWKVFAQELGVLCTEQAAFLTDLEWKVAVAEAIDPTHVMLFVKPFIPPSCGTHSPPPPPQAAWLQLQYIHI